MKKLTLIIAAILFCGSVFTSCKKDPNGNSGSNSKKLVEVRVNQTLSLASSSNDALNRAYDVKVIYFDAGNQIATHNFTPTRLPPTTSLPMISAGLENVSTPPSPAKPASVCTPLPSPTSQALPRMRSSTSMALSNLPL